MSDEYTVASTWIRTRAHHNFHWQAAVEGAKKRARNEKVVQQLRADRRAARKGIKTPRTIAATRGQAMPKTGPKAKTEAKTGPGGKTGKPVRGTRGAARKPSEFPKKVVDTTKKRKS
jgi:hypothetical protein